MAVLGPGVLGNGVIRAFVTQVEQGLGVRNGVGCITLRANFVQIVCSQMVKVITVMLSAFYHNGISKADDGGPRQFGRKPRANALWRALSAPDLASGWGPGCPRSLQGAGRS